MSTTGPATNGATPGAHPSIETDRQRRNAIKAKAVRSMEKGTRVAVLAKELGITETTLYNWRAAAAGKPYGRRKAPGKRKGKPARRGYPDAFKLEAVRRWDAGGERLTDIALDLDIVPSLLARWRREVRAGKFAAGKSSTAGPKSTPKSTASNRVMDAIVFLRQARDLITASIKAGTSTLGDPVTKYVLFALDSLEGTG